MVKEGVCYWVMRDHVVKAIVSVKVGELEGQIAYLGNAFWVKQSVFWVKLSAYWVK